MVCCTHPLNRIHHGVGYLRVAIDITHSDSVTNTTHDARVIIKPGSKGDLWWDTKQLITQVKRAVDIHDMKYGADVEAVFVFDQSSAHASYDDGALCRGPNDRSCASAR